MGLCKCKKKKVTNQFCFEHRVNVCEHCLVADHTQCIVQSYLQWLNDSKYDRKCAICSNLLDNEPCTRLVCYDVFHSSCLNKYGMSHPAHTAPAGFRCPQCKAALFPPQQLVSPVALALKATLSEWSWARNAMGFIDNGSDNRRYAEEVHTEKRESVRSSTITVENESGESPAHRTDINSLSSSLPVSHSLNFSNTEDEKDKYERRPLSVWFRRWWKSYEPLGRCGGRVTTKRRSVTYVAIAVMLLLLFLILLRSRSTPPDPSQLDPLFDPLNNPNIRVQEA